MSRDSASGFGIGLLVGVAAGLVVGMLYAPHSGPETRRLVRERAGDIRDRAGDVVESAKERLRRIRGKDEELEEEV